MKQHFLRRCENLHTFALGNKCKIYEESDLNGHDIFKT